MNMRRYLFLFFSILGALFYSPVHVFADGDFLSPAETILQVKPGDSFSQDIFFVSGLGADYDVSVRRFYYDKDGNKQFTDEVPSFLTSGVDSFTLQQGEQEHFIFSGTFPEELKNGDYYYALLVKRRAQEGELNTYQLASLFLIQVGDISPASFDLSRAEVKKSGDNIDGIDYTIETTGKQFFTLRPYLEMLDEKGSVVQHLPSLPVNVFPEFQRTTLWYYFGEKDAVVPDNVRDVELVFQDSHGVTVARKAVNIPPGTTIVHHAQSVSPYQQDQKLTVRHLFVWTDWLWRFLLIILGLCLIIFSRYYWR